MSDQNKLPGDEAPEQVPPDSSNKANLSNEEPELLRDQLFDRQDMLQFFKISDRTLHKWRKQKTIQYISIGGKFYYPKVYVEEMLRKNRVG